MMPAAATGERLPRTLRILHLEDDPHDRDLTEATLRSGGVDCAYCWVDDRAGFERALIADEFDIILADYNLPAFDGQAAYAVARRLSPRTPFIFLSGTLGEDLAVSLIKGGATDYVLKQRIARLPTAVQRARREAQERADRAHAEDQVRRLNAELEQRVAARTAELADTNRALARANVAKSEFLSRMSHDLRTPLNAILGFAQILELVPMDAAHHDSVQQILHAGRHLLGLINEVLDISRIESGRLGLSLEAVALADVVGHAVEIIRPLAATRELRVSVQPWPSPAPVLWADRQRLMQILLNLLSNAVKYNRPGGALDVGFLSPAAGRHRITVRDAGFGIPAEKLTLLFQPFERLGADRTSVEGTGLGLSLSRGLAQAMGGTLGVESIVDEGSVFWIELPEAAPDACCVARIDPIERSTDSGCESSGTVLYIEDNASNVRLMERILQQRQGIALLHAAEGRQGFELAKDRRPDLILLDMHLPDASGEDVIRWLWECADTRHIPIFVLTADATPGLVRRLIAAGATQCFTKPLEIRQVLRAIDERLHRASAQVARTPRTDVRRASAQVCAARSDL